MWKAVKLNLFILVITMFLSTMIVGTGWEYRFWPIILLGVIAVFSVYCLIKNVEKYRKDTYALWEARDVHLKETAV